MSHYVSLINGMSNAQADDLMSFATDLLDGSSGIVAATDYAVAQSSPVAMSVTVGTGKAYIYISSLLSYYRTILDAAAVLSIASNSSGSDRIDLICIKIDTGATPDADAINIATVVVVQGTPGAGAPSTPANHYKLAQVTVANGAVSIVTANIADSRSQIGVRSGVKVVEASLSLADNTTADASTTKHGLLKKLSNVATEFMNGAGNWVTAVTLAAAQALTNKDMSSITNTMPTPILGYAEVTATQSGITTEVDLTNLAITVTVPSGGKRIRISAYLSHVFTNRTTSDSRGVIRIKEGSTILQQAWILPFMTAGALGAIPVSIQAIFTPSAGSHTYKLTGLVDVGVGELSFFSASNAPAFIMVELL